MGHGNRVSSGNGWFKCLREIYTYICITHTRTYMCVHVCAYIIYMYVYRYAYIHMYKCMHMCMYECMYACMEVTKYGGGIEEESKTVNQITN